MLRITVHDDKLTWRMQLEGKFAGAWVEEVRLAWDTPARIGKHVSIDLTGVTGVDDAGRALLTSIRKSGARFIASGFAMKCLVREMAGAPTLALIASVLFLAFSISPLRAQEPAPLRLTLKDAVQMALKQNPQVAIANLNLVESHENRKVARAALLPQASFRASDQVTRGNPEALLGMRVPGFPGHLGPFWTLQAGPEFSAPIFDLTLWKRWQASKEIIGATAARQNTARELNAQLVVSQYLGALSASAGVEAAKSRLDLAQALFALASDLQKSGAGTSIDTLRANVQVQNEKQKYSEAGAQRKTGLNGLSRLLNLDPRQTIELADGPSFFETPAFASDESLTHAYEQRPELREVLAETRAAELRRSAAKAERLPRLSLNGGWSLQGLTPGTMIPAYQIGASVEVPLFTGGRIQAETAIADLEVRKLRQTEREVRNEIALDVKNALTQIDAARVQTEAAKLGVTLARESVRQARDRFRAGVANNIEVITAQDELARANDNQITALYRYNQSRADLARATGQMEAIYAQ